MGKFFIKDSQIFDNKISIIGDDVNHIKNVLRYNISDSIIVCDENGKNYDCEIKDINKDSIICQIISEIESNVESPIKISIFQGIPKFDKMELIIQKCVELGAYDFYPATMKRCIVKLDQNLINKKIDRWQKISEVASKQSGRDIIPKVYNPISIEEVINKIDDYDLFIIPYEKENKISLKDILKNIQYNDIINGDLKIGILIGPEGGIDDSEINLLKNTNAKVVTLGKRILRTETVALSMISIIMYELGL